MPPEAHQSFSRSLIHKSPPMSLPTSPSSSLSTSPPMSLPTSPPMSPPTPPRKTIQKYPKIQNPLKDPDYKTINNHLSIDQFIGKLCKTDKNQNR